MTAYGFIAVGVGAALGAWLRWIFSVLFNATLPNLPMGTLIANLVGGYLIGVAAAFFIQHDGLSPEWRLLIITGFLGGLTTFSSFSSESVGLLTRGEYGWAGMHIAAHLAGSIVMTVLGIASYRAIQS